MMRWAAALAVFFLAGLPSVAHGQAPDDAAEHYGLDDVERSVPAKGKMVCPKVALVTYRGQTLRYASAVRVYAGFADRLAKFEQVVRQVAIAHYGRAPAKILHLGTLNCRRIRLWPTLLSEHGLGNGIDVAGFAFGPLPRGAQLPAGVPAALRRPFAVKLKQHWSADQGADAVHARFLRAVADQLLARPDIFRVMLGPAYPGHKDHFHFDCAPWRLIEI